MLTNTQFPIVAILLACVMRTSATTSMNARNTNAPPKEEEEEAGGEGGFLLFCAKPKVTRKFLFSKEGKKKGTSPPSFFWLDIEEEAKLWQNKKKGEEEWS